MSLPCVLPVTTVGSVSHGAGTDGTSPLAEMIWVASTEASGRRRHEEKMELFWFLCGPIGASVFPCITCIRLPPDLHNFLCTEVCRKEASGLNLKEELTLHAGCRNRHGGSGLYGLGFCRPLHFLL